MRSRTFRQVVRCRYMHWLGIAALGLVAVHLAARMIWNLGPIYRQVDERLCVLDGYMPQWMLGTHYTNDPSLTAQCDWTDTFHWWDYHPSSWYELWTTHVFGLLVVAAIAFGAGLLVGLTWLSARLSRVLYRLARVRGNTLLLRWDLWRMGVKVSKSHPVNIEGTFDYNPRAHRQSTDGADTDPND